FDSIPNQPVHSRTNIIETNQVTALGHAPPLQVLRTHRRLYHVTPASHSSEESLNSRVPFLHSHYPLRHYYYGPPPLPSHLQSFSRLAGYTIHLAPAVSQWDRAWRSFKGEHNSPPTF